MNLVNRFFLRMVLLPARMYRSMGVSLPHLKAILHTKLVMDDRRPNTLHMTRREKQQKPIRFATIGMMLYTAILGCFFLVSFVIGNDVITKFTVYFSLYIFMLTSVLISDFTSVLIDVRDNVIILPKPVNDKTFVLARLLHILIHVNKIILPMTLPGLIAVGILYDALAVFSFLFLLAAASLFTVFLINAVYLFIIKVTTPEKFKNIISYFQIFVGIFLFAAYQLLPRMIGKGAINHYSVTASQWAFLLPPYWFGAAWDYLDKGVIFSPNGIYFLLSLAVPLGSVWVVIRYLAPAFSRKLSMISGSEETAVPVATKGKGRNKKISTTSVYVRSVAGWLTSRGTERISFLLSWKIMDRSRDFKMKVYPSIGYLLVYLATMFLNKRKISLADLAEQSNPAGRVLFVSMVYMSCFILITAIGRLSYSDKYKAAWIYYTTPIGVPGRLLSGSLKAAIMKFCFPLLSVISIAAIFSMGPRIIPNLVLGISNVVFTVTTIAYFNTRSLPFSEPEPVSLKGWSLIRSILAMLLPCMIGFLHYFIYTVTVVVIISGVLSIIATWMVLEGLRNKLWIQFAAAERAE